MASADVERERSAGLETFCGADRGLVVVGWRPHAGAFSASSRAGQGDYCLLGSAAIRCSNMFTGKPLHRHYASRSRRLGRTAHVRLANSVTRRRASSRNGIFADESASFWIFFGSCRLATQPVSFFYSFFQLHKVFTGSITPAPLEEPRKVFVGAPTRRGGSAYSGRSG